jgi:hypothetical protein
LQAGIQEPGKSPWLSVQGIAENKQKGATTYKSSRALLMMLQVLQHKEN